MMGLEAEVLTQVNGVNSKKPQTLGTGRLGIIPRTVNLVGLAAFDETELSREEDIIALAGTFKPFTQELFTISVKTIPTVSILCAPSMFISPTEYLLRAVPVPGT